MSPTGVLAEGDVSQLLRQPLLLRQQLRELPLPVLRNTHRHVCRQSIRTHNNQCERAFFFPSLRPNLELQLQSADLSDASVSLLVDQLHLRLQDPPLALCVAQAVGDLLVLVALQEPEVDCDEQLVAFFFVLFGRQQLLTTASSSSSRLLFLAFRREISSCSPALLLASSSLLARSHSSLRCRSISCFAA